MLNSHKKSIYSRCKFLQNEISKPQFLLIPDNCNLFITPKASVFCRMEDAVRRKTNIWLMIRVDSYNYKNHSYNN